ncbi:hypothetical protein WP5W18E06_20920 [Klebsiella quasipneumoniae]|nr:hypothetical protein WP5W18E06_20920 [Klebsiella quasipneumoniae]
MSITIRQATPDDATAIYDMIYELAVYEKAPEEVVTTAEEIRETLFASSSKTEALICEVAGKAVGYAVFFTSYSTWLGRNGIYMEDLYVTPDYRGIGAGKALLKTIAQYAVQRQCGRLEWSVLDWNQPAIDFYLSIGAQPQDEWVRYRLTGDAAAGLCGVKRLASRSAPGVDLLAADQASTALFCSCGPASARRAPASVSLYCLKLSINS